MSKSKGKQLTKIMVGAILILTLFTAGCVGPFLERPQPLLEKRPQPQYPSIPISKAPDINFLGSVIKGNHTETCVVDYCFLNAYYYDWGGLRHSVNAPNGATFLFVYVLTKKIDEVKCELPDYKDIKLLYEDYLITSTEAAYGHGAKIRSSHGYNIWHGAHGPIPGLFFYETPYGYSWGHFKSNPTKRRGYVRLIVPENINLAECTILINVEAEGKVIAWSFLEKPVGFF